MPDRRGARTFELLIGLGQPDVVWQHRKAAHKKQLSSSISQFRVAAHLETTRVNAFGPVARAPIKPVPNPPPGAQMSARDQQLPNAFSPCGISRTHEASQLGSWHAQQAQQAACLPGVQALLLEARPAGQLTNAGAVPGTKCGALVVDIRRCHRNGRGVRSKNVVAWV